MTQPYPAEAVERLRLAANTPFVSGQHDEGTVVRIEDLAALLSYVEGMDGNYMGAMADLESLIECCKRVCVENDIPGLRRFLALNYPRHVGLAAPAPDREG